NRAFLIAAAVAVTIVVFAVRATIALRADAEDERATQQLIESVEVAADMRQTYAALTSAMAMAATMRDASLTGEAFALNEEFDAQLAHLGQLMGADPALRKQYESLLAVRERSFAYAGPYTELV